MQKTLEIVSANRAELAPSEVFQEAGEEQIPDEEMLPEDPSQESVQQPGM